MPKIHQNTSGGRSTPGPAGGAYALPQISQPQWAHTSKGRGKGRRSVSIKGTEGRERRREGREKDGK